MLIWGVKQPYKVFVPFAIRSLEWRGGDMHNHSITALILTYNEEKHIARCINSLKEYYEILL